MKALLFLTFVFLVAAPVSPYLVLPTAYHKIPPNCRRVTKVIDIEDCKRQFDFVCEDKKQSTQQIVHKKVCIEVTDEQCKSNNPIFYHICTITTSKREYCYYQPVVQDVEKVLPTCHAAEKAPHCIKRKWLIRVCADQEEENATNQTPADTKILKTPGQFVPFYRQQYRV